MDKNVTIFKWTQALESLLKLNLTICINLVHSTSPQGKTGQYFQINEVVSAQVPNKLMTTENSAATCGLKIVFPDTNDISSFLFWKEKSPTRKKMQGSLLSCLKQ